MKGKKLVAATWVFTACAAGIGTAQAATDAPQPTPAPMTQAASQVHYRYLQVQDVRVFYREAGNPANPTVVLLHGLPSSSFMYRNLIPVLAQRYHVIAPDLPGFGRTESPARGKYAYTFAQLTETIDQFTAKLGLTSYALQVFDYGAPVGLRLASAHPERVTAIISQNGNAYEEGLSQGWAPIQRYWKTPTEANRNALRAFFEPEAIKGQYAIGVADPGLIAPETYLQDTAAVQRPGNVDIQLDLFADYRSNVELYPVFQAYFREHQPPLLAVWGKNDQIFLAAGATAFKRDLKNAQVHLYDTGHFALETHGEEIGQQILSFLDRNVKRN